MEFVKKKILLNKKTLSTSLHVHLTFKCHRISKTADYFKSEQQTTKVVFSQSRTCMCIPLALLVVTEVRDYQKSI